MWLQSTCSDPTNGFVLLRMLALMFNPQSFIRQLIYHFILIAWLPVIFFVCLFGSLPVVFSRRSPLRLRQADRQSDQQLNKTCTRVRDKRSSLCQLPLRGSWRDRHFFTYPVLFKRHGILSRTHVSVLALMTDLG